MHAAAPCCAAVELTLFLTEASSSGVFLLLFLTGAVHSTLSFSLEHCVSHCVSHGSSVFLTVLLTLFLTGAMRFSLTQVPIWILRPHVHAWPPMYHRPKNPLSISMHPEAGPRSLQCLDYFGW